MAQSAKVTAINGRVLVINEAGQPRLIAVGDEVLAGETVRPAPGAEVQLQLDDGQALQLGADQAYQMGADAPVPADPTATGAVQGVIEALASGADLSTELEAAAAGLGAGGAGGDGSSFVRLERVSEGVSPLSYEYGVGVVPTVETVVGTSAPVAGTAAIGSVIDAGTGGGGDTGGGGGGNGGGGGGGEDLPVLAGNDFDTASVIVTQNPGDFNNDSLTYGGRFGSDAFVDGLDGANGKYDGNWLVSDQSFHSENFQDGFTITDQGAGPDSAFVVTPDFQASSGEQFNFSVELHDSFQPGDDSVQAQVYVKTPDGWTEAPDGAITVSGDGSYSYEFQDEGTYRVGFNVNDQSGGGDKASASITIDSNDYFTGGGDTSVSITCADGTLLSNDLLGDPDTSLSLPGSSVGSDGLLTAEGDHGVLTVDPSDGSYTYVPTGESGGIDTFGYTITDADGDTSSAQLSVTVDYQVLTANFSSATDEQIKKAVSGSGS